MARIIKKVDEIKISLGEFRAWLSGVEDVQPKNWVPTKDQWKAIRRKIGQIEETARQSFQPEVHHQVPVVGLRSALEPVATAPQVIQEMPAPRPGRAVVQAREQRRTAQGGPGEGPDLPSAQVPIPPQAEYQSTFE